MLDLHDPKQAYEIFTLQWMIEHGYSVLDLLKNLEAMIENFDRALSHPDAEDLARLTEAVRA